MPLLFEPISLRYLLYSRMVSLWIDDHCQRLEMIACKGLLPLTSAWICTGLTGMDALRTSWARQSQSLRSQHAL